MGRKAVDIRRELLRKEPFRASPFNFESAPFVSATEFRALTIAHLPRQPAATNAAELKSSHRTALPV
jgi:hypothetical protein